MLVVECGLTTFTLDDEPTADVVSVDDLQHINCPFCGMVCSVDRWGSMKPTWFIDLAPRPGRSGHYVPGSIPGSADQWCTSPDTYQKWWIRLLRACGVK